MQSVFFLIFILHQSLCQQTSQQFGQQTSQQFSQQQTQPQQQYSQQTAQYTATPQSGKVQLEDIERDNLKNTQTPATNTQPQVQPQQYITYPQDQLFYTLQPQQAAALFQNPQQPVTSLYAAQPSTSGIVSPQQQQFFVPPYYTQPAAAAAAAAPQSYPSYVDFGNFPFYPAVYPYAVPQTASQTGQVAQVSPNVVSDYFKSAAAVQPSAAQVKTQQIPQVQASLKAAPTAQIPSLNNYLLSNTLPNTYYQPVSFTQPQNPQFYSYNSFYPTVPNTAAKSVFSSGIKSTTPSSPTKLKEEPFVPVNNGNYRYDFATAEQNNYNKVRVSG